MRHLAEGVLVAALALPALAHEAPGALAFTPPVPGTYALPPIAAAPDGLVLDTAGRSRRLSDYTKGRITLLGLVYTRCTDPEGCPRATWAFSAVRSLLRGDPALKRRVRFVTLSFDPAHDVPGVLAEYARRTRGERGDPAWHFVTAASRASLAPILEGFGQDLRVAAQSDAVPGTEEFTHYLKVFLMDSHGRVREIYSTGFLAPPVIVNDIRTLARERAYAPSPSTGTQLQKRLRSP
jgi:cytochrome oxidase Cu insertion factor (SCO1/SenC/PrrC family)